MHKGLEPLLGGGRGRSTGTELKGAQRGPSLPPSTENRPTPERPCAPASPRPRAPEPPAPVARPAPPPARPQTFPVPSPHSPAPARASPDPPRISAPLIIRRFSCTKQRRLRHQSEKEFVGGTLAVTEWTGSWEEVGPSPGELGGLVVRADWTVALTQRQGDDGPGHG